MDSFILGKRTSVQPYRCRWCERSGRRASAGRGQLTREGGAGVAGLWHVDSPMLGVPGSNRGPAGVPRARVSSRAADWHRCGVSVDIFSLGRSTFSLVGPVEERALLK